MSSTLMPCDSCGTDIWVSTWEEKPDYSCSVCEVIKREDRQEAENEMMEKVKLTQEQADAVKTAVAKFTFEESMENHLAGWISPARSCLNGINTEELARALLIGYEIEETYKVGDWVRYWRTDCSAIIGKIEVIAEKERLFKADNCPDERRISDITRHATPEEIKAEKERRVWAEIGREVGEFKPNDVVIFETGASHTLVIGYDFEWYKENYKNIKMQGFYPSESFIKFGGADG